MPISSFHRTAIILIVLSLNCYAIIQAIIYKNLMGVLLAIGSVIALGLCIHLMRKLKEMEAAEDEQLLH